MPVSFRNCTSTLSPGIRLATTFRDHGNILFQPLVWSHDWGRDYLCKWLRTERGRSILGQQWIRCLIYRQQVKYDYKWEWTKYDYEWGPNSLGCPTGVQDPPRHCMILELFLPPLKTFWAEPCKWLYLCTWKWLKQFVAISWIVSLIHDWYCS